jgi:hypothetical protein
LKKTKGKKTDERDHVWGTGMWFSSRKVKGKRLKTKHEITGTRTNCERCSRMKNHVNALKKRCKWKCKLGIVSSEKQEQLDVKTIELMLCEVEMEKLSILNRCPSSGDK